MMLEHLGERDAAAAVERAIESLLADAAAPRPADLGGAAGTAEVAAAIVSRM
jgi:tartrate dehydrogenase/decarboxylase/D-malate dehydrogenase